jgi:hypothetical protein
MIAMKYKRMVCWVRDHEKQALQSVINAQFPVIFVDDYVILQNTALDDDYIIISLAYASSVHMLQAPIHYYELLEEELITVTQFNAMESQHAVKGQYSAQELVGNYLGLIDDLWAMRQQTPRDLETRDYLVKKLRDALSSPL